MPTLEFVPSLQRHAPCPPLASQADQLRQLLQQGFEQMPRLQSYVRDDQGHIRKHVAVFINQTLHLPRDDMARALRPDDKVLVIQCLAGG